MERLTLALLASVVLASPALAQSPPVRTKSYTYEWMHLRASGSQGVDGWLFMGDVRGHHSQLQGFLRDTVTGAFIFNCSGPQDGFAPLDVPPASMQDFNIVEVGPFAQQATADAAPIMQWLHSFCPNAPDILTVSCPYQGLPAAKAPDHVAFRHSGTYRGAANQRPSSYSQNGHRDSTVCDVLVDGAVYAFDGSLTHIKETRGGDTAPSVVWQEPSGWLGIEDVARHPLPPSS